MTRWRPESIIRAWSSECSWVPGAGSGCWRVTPPRAVEPLAGRTVTALAREQDTVWAIVDGTSLWQGQHGAWTQCAAIAGPPATCRRQHAGRRGRRHRAGSPPAAGRRPTRADRFVRDDGGPWRLVHAVGRSRGRAVHRASAATARSTSTSTSAASHARVTAARRGRPRWTSRTTSTRSWPIPRAPRSCSWPRPRASASAGTVAIPGSSPRPGSTRTTCARWRSPASTSWCQPRRGFTAGARRSTASASTAAPASSGVSRGCRSGSTTTSTPACLAADGALVAFGTGDGRVFRSRDAGEHWELVIKGLPPVACVLLA